MQKLPTITDGTNYVLDNFLEPSFRYAKNNKLFVTSCVISAVINPAVFFGATAASTCIATLTSKIKHDYKSLLRAEKIKVHHITTFSPNIRAIAPIYTHCIALACRLINNSHLEKAHECLKVISAKVGYPDILGSEFMPRFSAIAQNAQRLASAIACAFNGIVLGREIAKIITLGVEEEDMPTTVIARSMGIYTWEYQVPVNAK